MDREKHAFFVSVQRQEKEVKELRDSDADYRKRWLLKCMSGGFGRHQASRPKKVTLPKLSWEGKE